MRKLLLVIVLTLLLIQFAQPIVQVKAATRTLNIISPHPESIRTEFANAFKAWYLQKYNEAVDVNWLDFGGTSADVAYVESQFKTNPNGIGQDMMFGGGTDPFIKIASEGYFASYKLPDALLSQVPSSLSGIPMYDSHYLWYGAVLSGFGIMYNKPVLQKLGLPVPKTWTDLMIPAAQGWISAADTRQSGSTHMAYEIMLQGYGWTKGWQVITEIGANTKSFPTSSGAVPPIISSGDVAYGLVIDFYAWAEIAKNGADKVGYVLPDGLTVINPDSIAIIKGAPNMDLAQRFEEFVLSDPGQSLWMLPAGAPGGPKTTTLGRMSVVPGLYSRLGASSIVPVNPFNLKNTLNYDPNLGAARFSVVNDMIGSMIIDQHDALLAAWNKINTAAKAQGVTNASLNPAIAALGASPITEQQASQYGNQWQDQVFRNQQISNWRQFAITKYGNASSLADKAVNDAQTAMAAQQAAAAAAAAQQQQLIYIGGGIVVLVLIAAGVYFVMKRRKEAAEVKK
jgi:ABC-type Fe3+ transport system substrate-binding protein